MVSPSALCVAALPSRTICRWQNSFGWACRGEAVDRMPMGQQSPSPDVWELTRRRCERRHSSIYRRLGRVWRLRTTVWVCRACQSRGVDDALRGLMVQFSCLRCATYLVRQHDELTAAPRPVDPADEAFQREMIAALADGGDYRFDNAIHLAIHATDRLLRDGGAVPETRALLSVSKAAVLDCVRQRSVLPEHPRIVAFILRRTWILAASDGVTNIAQAALGRAMPWSDDVPGYFDHLSADELAPTDAWSAIRIHSRSLGRWPAHRRGGDAGGLRSVDVPWDVRYAVDDLVIDDAAYRWRLYVCLHLRYWLKSLESDGRADRFDDRVIDPMVLRSSRIVGRRADAAAIFLAHLVQLAEDLTTTTAARDTPAIVPDLDMSTLRELAPTFVMHARRRAVRIARYWMWLDLVAGQDAYGHLPTCSPPEVRMFEEMVGERAACSLLGAAAAGAFGPGSDR